MLRSTVLSPMSVRKKSSLGRSEKQFIEEKNGVEGTSQIARKLYECPSIGSRMWRSVKWFRDPSHCGMAIFSRSGPGKFQSAIIRYCGLSDIQAVAVRTTIATIDLFQPFFMIPINKRNTAWKLVAQFSKAGCRHLSGEDTASPSDLVEKQGRSPLHQSRLFHGRA